MKSIAQKVSVTTVLTLVLAVANVASAADDKDKERKTTNKDVIQGHAPHKATQLTKMSVQNAVNEKLGSINDLAIELPSGRLAYVLVSAGGVLGIGADLKPIPPQAFTAHVGDSNTVTLDITKERWESAPTVKKEKGRVAILSDETQAKQIYAFYNQEWRKEYSLKAGPAEIKIDLPKATGRETTNEIRLASEMLGKDVLSRDQQNLGRLHDFLVDLTGGQVTFAIVAPGRGLEADEQGYALAPRVLNMAPDKQFTASVDRSTLDQAPLLEPGKAAMPDLLRKAMGAFRYRETAPRSEVNDKDKDGVSDQNEPKEQK